MEDEPTAKRQKTDRVLDMTDEATALHKAAECSAYMNRKNEGKFVPPYTATDITHDPDRDRHSVGFNIDKKPGPFGDGIGFIDSDSMKINMSPMPSDPVGKQTYEWFQKEFGFTDSKLAEAFFTKVEGPAGNKIWARFKAKAEKKGLSGRDAVKMMMDAAAKDNAGDKPAFTKKLVKKKNPDDEEDDTPELGVTMKIVQRGDGPRAPKITEDELQNIPSALHDLARGDLRPCPFFNISGARIPWPEFLATCAVSKNGTPYFRFTGRVELSGGKMAWTTGTGSDNYNRILTIPYVKKITVCAAIQSRQMEEEEAPDDDLVAACQMAGAL